MRRLLLATIMASLVATLGTAAADDVTATPFMVFEIQHVGQDFIGLVPEGIRLDGHHTGVITDGLGVGATTRSVDYFLYRHDGVGVMHTRGFGAFPDGATVSMTLTGFLGEPMQGLLEAMLDPAFEAPDVDIPLHGAAWFQSMAPQYAFLNYTVFGCVGTVNLVQSVGRITCRSLAP